MSCASRNVRQRTCVLSRCASVIPSTCSPTSTIAVRRASSCSLSLTASRAVAASSRSFAAALSLRKLQGYPYCSHSDASQPCRDAPRVVRCWSSQCSQHRVHYCPTSLLACNAQGCHLSASVSSSADTRASAVFSRSIAMLGSCVCAAGAGRGSMGTAMPMADTASGKGSPSLSYCCCRRATCNASRSHAFVYMRGEPLLGVFCLVLLHTVPITLEPLAIRQI